jgi:hypothetical protein
MYLHNNNSFSWPTEHLSIFHCLMKQFLWCLPTNFLFFSKLFFH